MNNTEIKPRSRIRYMGGRGATPRTQPISERSVPVGADVGVVSTLTPRKYSVPKIDG